MNSLFGRLRSNAANIASRAGAAIGGAARAVAGGARRVVRRVANAIGGRGNRPPSDQNA